MMNDDDFLCMQALQALGLIPEPETEAEPAFERAAARLKAVEDELEPLSPPKPRSPSIAFSLLREQINQVGMGGLDDPGIEDVCIAVAIGEIREVARWLEDEIEESRTAPRRADVRDWLDLLATRGREVAAVLKSPYVADALDRELDLGALPDERGRRRSRHTIRSRLSRAGSYRVIGLLIQALAIVAERALDRRLPLITADGTAYGPPYYNDLGGRGTAYEIGNLPLKKSFVMRCLALFGEYRPGVASASPDGPFARFAQTIWSLSTGEEVDLSNAIKTAFRNVRSGDVSPALLAALLDLPDGTLPPRK